MGKRRFKQVSTSEEDEEERGPEVEEVRKRRRKKRLIENDEEEDDRIGGGRGGAAAAEREGEGEGEPVQEDAKPFGEQIRVSGKGKSRKTHYSAFEYDGNHFELEDSVLLTPEEKTKKPYVAIIKDITQAKDGTMMVTGQWFYRPEEAEKKGGGSWESHDSRELFYSFHHDDVPAESVMHKCVVHFVPLNKQLPVRSVHPGFIVRRVYDTVERKLWKLTDKDYEDGKQHEIDLLVQKTRERIGELPDLVVEDVVVEHEDQLKKKRSLRKANMQPIDVSRDDDVITRVELKPETPGSWTAGASEFYVILANSNALTGDTHRDKWLEKLLQGIQPVCNPMENEPLNDKLKDSSNGAKVVNGSQHVDGKEKANSSDVKSINGSQHDSMKDGERFCWPDDAVAAVTALEKASHDSLGSEYLKYNQKMRQLDFNLKDGLTADEKASKEPDRSERMQMTDARCSRCMEKKVGVADIIQAGIGSRYQLECTACGHTWYASRDAISSLTIDTPNAVSNVGTAPWATAKFDAVEKKLVSPRGESEKPSSDSLQKSTAAYMPVLETHKSFNKSKPGEPSGSAPANKE
ncbi:hypothetical protein QJS04_geneDACA000424 [Acorus gramineus]|uniref:BAH domain-containing protein n=1 Tax=Acorus gramineus TaxID=55184 RepID=A0AAV9ARC2_ACOGR|nr:hypothetical protein QJS04_geneDACA000424 [Acorus gramineus]